MVMPIGAMRRRWIVSLLALAVVAGAARGGEAALPNRPLAKVDLQRYVGRWHEIANLPMFFQRHCVSDVTAQYTLRADGGIEVRNACRDKEGALKVANGVARVAGPAQGALKVRFAPAWLTWLPWVWADYWVVEIDPQYRWAVVGSPSRKYLWVLSRAPSMRQSLYDTLMRHARERGYDTGRMVVVAPLE